MMELTYRRSTVAKLAATGPKKHPSWTGSCVLTAIDHECSIDEYVGNPFGILMRLGKCRMIADSVWIENNDVRD